MPDDLRAIAADKAANLLLRIGKTEWNGNIIWVKKAVPPKMTIWNKLQQQIAKLAKMPVLRPTSNPGGKKGLALEARRIEKFREKGFIAPAVLGLTDEWIVLEDLGEMVERKFQKDKALMPSDIRRIILQCAQAVATVHQAGVVHGRAKLNDLVLTKDGAIGFIDFEEDIEDCGIPLQALKARDLWLFLCTTARFAAKCPYITEEAFSAYLSVAHDRETLLELKKLVKFLRPFKGIIKPFLPMLKGDAQRAYHATTVLLAAPELKSIT